MPFHVDRFCLSYKDVVGKDPSSVLGIRLTDYKSMKTPANKANFIRKLMDKLMAKNTRRVGEKVMLECGYMMRDGVSRCINEHKIKRTKQLYAESKNIEDFIRKLGEHSGGNFGFEGNSIRATYSKCYCGSVSRTKEKIPLIYCYCGAGWYKRLFEETLGRSVKVEVLQSIANGADECVLKIYGAR